MSRTRRRKSNDQVLNEKEGSNRRVRISKKSSRNTSKSTLRQIDFDRGDGLIIVDEDLYSDT